MCRHDLLGLHQEEDPLLELLKGLGGGGDQQIPEDLGFLGPVLTLDSILEGIIWPDPCPVPDTDVELEESTDLSLDDHVKVQFYLNYLFLTIQIECFSDGVCNRVQRR